MSTRRASNTSKNKKQQKSSNHKWKQKIKEICLAQMKGPVQSQTTVKASTPFSEFKQDFLEDTGIPLNPPKKG